jgi:hypothetical protein
MIAVYQVREVRHVKFLYQSSSYFQRCLLTLQKVENALQYIRIQIGPYKAREELSQEESEDIQVDDLADKSAK